MEPETLGDVDMSTFPRLGVGNVGKLTELAAAALWGLGLEFLGLNKSFDSLGMCIHDLGMVDLYLL